MSEYIKAETATEQEIALTRSSTAGFDFEQLVILPVLSVLVALLLGCVIMLLTGVDLTRIGLAYGALFTGAFGSLSAISETLTAAAPVTLTALGIALGFRAGLFNIGAEGQMIVGGLASVYVGFAITDMPWFIHLPLALAAGAIVGAAWGALPGWLKAGTGAHEVITTIMLNLMAMQLTTFLLRNPPLQRPGRPDAISQNVLPTAQLPKLLDWIDPNLRLNAGIVIALLMVVLVYWLLFRTTVGFEFRATGLNPSAARYAGMRSSLITVAVMSISGALAGLAGGVQVLGVLGHATVGFTSGAGFNGIAVALLGRSHPVGVLLAGILFGALEAGGRQMQVAAGVKIDLIAIIQALIIIFVAAPLLMRAGFPWAFRKGGKAGT